MIRVKLANKGLLDYNKIMLASLILHPATRRTLEALRHQPPQALLLTGPTGTGKSTVAQAWAEQVAGASAITHVTPDEKGSIGIDAIRDLYRASRTRHTTWRIIILRQADAMSLEAQNAFLKLLEEPRPYVVFLLCADNAEALLPTILSRVQQVALQPVSDEALRALITKRQPSASPTDIQQLLFIAEGRVGVLHQLLDDPTRLQGERQTVQLAKQLLTDPPYERLRRLTTIANDRATCTATLRAMMRITEVQLTKSRSADQQRHWLGIAHALEGALHAITNNGNLKAQLLQLFSRY